jgi:hypothetical protein
MFDLTYPSVKGLETGSLNLFCARFAEAAAIAMLIRKRKLSKVNERW